MLAAFRASPGSERLAFYEVGTPLNPNSLLDITTYEETKARAIECFTSQLAQQDYGRQILALNAFRSYTLPTGVRLAEAYLIVDRQTLEQAPDVELIPDLRRCWKLAPEEFRRRGLARWRALQASLCRDDPFHLGDTDGKVRRPSRWAAWFRKLRKH